jgi:hypothetical protein
LTEDIRDAVAAAWNRPAADLVIDTTHEVVIGMLDDHEIEVTASAYFTR